MKHLRLSMKRFQSKKKKQNKEINISHVIDSEIKGNSIRQGFSKGIQTYSQRFNKLNYNSHKDMTHIPFVTIDGENSKDFDDAVFAEVNNEKIKILVAIADVSFFVKKGDPIDIEARKRGNSFYFPDRVIPMLPEILSNNICSLVPNQIRASLVCEIILKNTKVIKYKFHRAKILSKARLTYKEVDEIHKNTKKNKISKLIDNLFKALETLKKVSENRGKIEFKVKEYEINFRNDKEFKFEEKENFKSYRLIEEFMVLANNVVATHLNSNGVKSAYRNHEKPKDEKIKELKKSLKLRNIKEIRDFRAQKDFNFYLKKTFSKQTSFINDLMLRAQSKAYYDIKNMGHFGLGLNHYTHFTSPIRRYSDLLVHRDLIEMIFNKKLNKNKKELMNHLTFQEKKSDELERKINDRLCSIYIKINKKKFFTGIVDGIESFGIFIKAVELPFSALARFSKFHNNEENINYKFGQLVSFKIIRNNIKNGKILAGNVKLLEKNE